MTFPIWKNKIHVPNHQSGCHHLTIYLVGGFNHLEKYKFVNGKDDIPIPYMKWTNKSHVPNHQSVVYQLYYIWINHGKSWEVIYSWMFLLRILYDHYIATIISTRDSTSTSQPADSPPPTLASDAWPPQGSFPDSFAPASGHTSDGRIHSCVADLWVIYGWFMGELWLIYGWFMVFYGWFMGDLWVIYGVLWMIYGCFMGDLWVIYGWFMGDLWMNYGCLMEDLRVISILWQNNGISFSSSASDLACAQLTYWLPDIWWLSHMLHGAGIYTYKTGWFLSGKCWDSYSSTMDHMGIMTYWCLFTYFFGCEIHMMSNSKCWGPWGWMMNVGGWRKSLRHGFP